VAVAGVAGLPEPSLTETRHSASSASTPNFEPPVRVWERVPSGEEHLTSPPHPVCSRRCARGVGGHARLARARADARPCAVDALEGTSFMDEDISVVAALEISPVHKRMHAANARASPPRASPGRGRRADAAQQLRWDADSGGRSPPAGRPSPRARVDEVFLSDSELDDDDDRPAAPPAPAFARRASPLPLPPPPATAAAAAAAAATRDGAQPIYESSEPRPAAADALGLSAPAAEPGVAGVQRAQWGGAAGRVARDQEPPELLRVWATRSRRAEGGVRAPGEGGKEGRDVSGQYGKRDETCPVSTGGGEAEVSGLPSGLITSPLMVA